MNIAEPEFGPWHEYKGFRARIILDSVSPLGVRLTTCEVRFFRGILAEVNTHRMLTRNSASSRAIPLSKMIDAIRADPYLPIYWGKNQSGMSAADQLTGQELADAKAAVQRLLEVTLTEVAEMERVGLHKQHANRYLEPFAWHTALITASDLRNFFALRADANAQPEIRALARVMYAAYKESTPQQLAEGEWHLPLLTAEERELAKAEPDYWKAVSSGRAARTSYLTHSGLREPDKDVELHDRLLAGGHMSPFEHVARPMTAAEGGPDSYSGNFRGWVQYRKQLPNEHDWSLTMTEEEFENLMNVLLD